MKWYVDGVEDPSLENQTQVTFDRPSDNSVKVYTWRVDDLTGTVKLLMMLQILMTFMKAYLTQIFIGTIMSLSNGDITLLIELNMTMDM